MALAEQLPRRSDVTELLRSAPAATDELLIQRVAEQLSRIDPSSSPANVLQLGELVYREIYGQDRRVLNRGAKHPSLRRLALHPSVPFKVTTLWRAVSIYEMSLRFPQLFEMPSLTISHFRAVIGLPVDTQRRLLTNAAQQRWTKRRLEQEAGQQREGQRRRGRRPLPPALKWARELERVLARSAELEVADGKISDDAAEEIQATLRKCRERCRALESGVATLAATS
ncbi:MAG TPA: hypothetical protein VKZ49_00445 [Polyangiaceae bacterium]|nr:hypothetical protein [Polyangiaceae bacterium]